MKETEVAALHVSEDPKVECYVPLPSLVTEVRAQKGKRTTTTSESQRQERTRVSRQVCVRTHARPCTRQEERLTYLSGIPSVLRTVLIGVKQVMGRSCISCNNTKERGGPRGGAEDPARSGGTSD